MMADRARAAVFYRELLERVAALPGVAAAGAVNRRPLEGPWWGNYFVVEGRPVALGAPRASLVGLVVGQGMALVGGGALVGLILALGLTRLLASLLYGVGATDPGTFVAVGLVLLAATLAACILPARRAARVDPILALRRE